MSWLVNIIDADTNEVVKSLVASNEIQAEKIANGVNIELNYDRYFTQVVEDKS